MMTSSAKTLTSVSSRQKLQKQDIPLCAAVGLMFLLALLPSFNVYITFVLAPIILWLLFTSDDYYALLPIFLFFSEQLILTVNNPIFRIYSYLFFAKFIISKKKVDINPILLPTVLVIVLYSAFALMHADTSIIIKNYLLKNLKPPSNFMINFRLVFKTMVDMTFIMLMAQILKANRKLSDRFFIVWVLAAVASGIYGFTAHNIFDYNMGFSSNTGAEISVVRYNGSFNDPNYMCLFMTSAIFAVVTLDVFKKRYLKYSLLAILYFFVLASGSLTAIIVNILAWAVYIILKYKKASILILLVAAVAGLGTFFTVTHAPVLKNLSVVQNLEERVNRQFKSGIENSSADTLTSNRSKQWEYYINYYKKENIYKKLFGGNIVTSMSLDPVFVKENNAGVPHQAYLGFLIDFGAVGLILVVGCFILKNVVYILHYIRSKSDYMLMLLMINFLWAVYAMTLDYFANWKLMFCYFL
ncbi:MAG: O-antigen ligase family protein [Bacillota bacterium]|nr:O-antigen ligase family protein [Bacillota bacterium]